MAQVMKKEKAFKAKLFLSSKPPTFTIKGVEFLNCGCDLRTNMVTIKNIKTRVYKDIDFDKLQKIIEDEKQRTKS